MKTSLDGFILNVSPYKERQAALLILGPNGKETLFITIASSSKSASFAATSVGAYSRFHFQEKKGKQALSDIQLLHHPMRSLTTIHPLLAYETLIELTLKYVQEESSARYYIPFKNAVNTLSHQPLVALNEYYRFLIEENGIPLVLDRCVECDTKKGIHALSVAHGGFLCKSCAIQHNQPSVPVEQLIFIRDFYKRGPQLGIHEEALLRLLKLHHDHAFFAFNTPLIAYQNYLTLYSNIHS